MLLALKYKLDMIDAKEEGRDEGRNEGINIGYSKGRDEGAKQRSVSIAIKMLKRGKSVEEIADLTELSIDEINKLKNI